MSLPGSFASEPVAEAASTQDLTTRNKVVRPSVTRPSDLKKIRVALIPRGDVKVLEDIQALAEAKLTDTGRIALVERTLVRKVLNEQTLALINANDDATMLRLGQMVSADVFAVVTAVEGKLSSIVVFDSRTGACYANRPLPEKEEDAADAIVTTLRAADRKRTGSVDGAVTVSMLAVRNVELPRSYDTSAQTLAGLIEQYLLMSERVSILDRRHLDLISKEQDLSQQAQMTQLRASCLQLNLELNRGAMKGQVSAVLTHNGTALTFFGKSAENDLPSLAEQLANAFLDHLGEHQKLLPLNRATEAKRYASEANLLSNNMRLEAALACAESALALEPENGAFAQQVVKLLFSVSEYVLDPKLYQHTNVWEVKTTPEKMTTALDALERISVLTQQYESKGLFFDSFTRSTLAYSACRPLEKMLKAKQGHTPETLERFHQMQRYFSAWDKRVCYLPTLKRVHDVQTFFWYVHTIDYRLMYHRVMSVSSREYAEEFARMTDDLLTVLKDRTPADCPRELASCFCGPFFGGETLKGYITLQTADYDILTQAASRMAEHPISMVSLQGERLLRWFQLERDPENKRGNAAKAFQTVLDRIQAFPPEKPLYEYELLYDEAMVYMHMQSWSDGTTDAFRKRLIDVMFLRNDLATSLALDAVSSAVANPPKTKEACRVALTDIDRMIAMSKTASPERYSARKPGIVTVSFHDSFLRQMTDFRDQFVLAHPHIAPMMKAPWVEAVRLFQSEQNDIYHQIALPLRRDHILLLPVLEYDVAKKEATISMTLFNLNTRQGKTRARHPFAWYEGEWKSSAITRGFLWGDYAYYATSKHGVLVYSMKDDTVSFINMESGLPGNYVSAVGRLGDSIYVGVYGASTHLVKVSATTGKVEIIGSSMRQPSASPFDGYEPYLIRWFLQEEQTDRLIFGATRGKGPQHSGEGLWAIGPDGVISHIQDFHYVASEYPPSVDDLGRIIFCGMYGVIFDPVKKQSQWIYSYNEEEPRSLLPGEAPQKPRVHSMRAFGKAVLIDDWYWCPDVWSRISLKTGIQQRLPYPDDVAFEPRDYIDYYSGNDAVLAADHHRLWMFELSSSVNASSRSD